MRPEIIFTSAAAIENLLESLHFSGYKFRENNVKEAVGDTFAWIHGKEAPDPIRGASSTFSIWLERNSKAIQRGQKPSVFWIRGKAGSGKPTMMKRLVSSHQTSQMLSLLPEGLPVCTASFFFQELAKDSDHLENTIEGGLRSILYQLIRQDMTLGRDLITPRFTEFSKFHKWTLALLNSALASLLSTARTKNIRICIFLDGLDEVNREQQITLADFLQQTHEASPEVLMCFSSRPTLSLPEWVPDVCELDLAICNHYDILSYVTDKIQSFIPDQRVLKRVCDRADDVFLWAVLVTQRLIMAKKSLKENLSDERVIDKCLADKGLDKLIGVLLANAGGTNSRFYFHVTMMDASTRQETDIASMTAARSPELLETTRNLRRLVTRVFNRSAHKAGAYSTTMTTCKLSGI